MLTGDRERALQQSIDKRGGNGKVPKIGSARKCLFCHTPVTGHSPYIEFVMLPKLIEPAIVIGSEPKVKGSRPSVATFCKPCGELVLPHVHEGLLQMFGAIITGVQEAQAELSGREVNEELPTDDDFEELGGE